MGRKAHDLTGHRYGLWTVLRLVGSFPDGKPKWVARCDCGTEREVRASTLKAGGSISCGCLRKAAGSYYKGTHRLSNTKLYRCWADMKQRCSNPNNDRYSAYGYRGIKVTSRWEKSFSNFYADMGKSYFHGATIDRIDVNGDYEPSNCRWVTFDENNKHRRNTIYVEYEGRKQRLVDLADAAGLPRRTVLGRRSRGYPVDRCLT